MNLVIVKHNLMNWLDLSQHIEIIPSDYLNVCFEDGDSKVATVGTSCLNCITLNFDSPRCQNLEYLDLYGCVNVTSRDIKNVASNLTIGSCRISDFKQMFLKKGICHTTHTMVDGGGGHGKVTTRCLRLCLFVFVYYNVCVH
ncbi:Leucine-rich repeat, cysteine-containing subtype, partial [Cynara cardunculus var. scolymus]